MDQPSERPSVHDRLLQSEERFRLLFEDAPVAYHEIDVEGRISRVNRAECTMLGYEPSELIGRRVWDLVAPGERDLCREGILQKLSGAARLDPLQRRFLRKNGDVVTLGIYQNLIEDERGRITGIRGILINLTEREQAMEAMLASETKFRDLFDNVIDGVYQSTPDGRLLTVNPALVKMLGYESQAEFLRVDANTLYVDPAERTAGLSRLESDGELRNCELKLRTKKGGVI